MSLDEYDLLVIGGGAAGFFGALAFTNRCPAGRVMILEKGNVLLSKVRISGGGRCNVTHACFDPGQLTEFYPRGSKALRGPFHRFQPSDTVHWFEQRGVALKTEPDGRMFPISDSSETIVEVFLSEARRSGIKIQTRQPVSGLKKTEQGFIVETKSGERIKASTVLLTTGGDRAAYTLAQSLGHTIVPPVPSLFTFHIQDLRLEGLSGVSVEDALLTLPESGHTQRGPVLITHWGLSGPVVIKLSAWAARDLAAAQYRTILRINWLPDFRQESFFQILQEMKALHPHRQISTQDPTGKLSKRLWRQLALAVLPDEQTWAETSNRQLAQLAEEITRGQYQIIGKSTFKEEFVTAGGVSLKEVNFKTMESRLCPGLYFAGEVLDIDGVTGGFNFQNAWTTAWIAGNAIADLNGICR